MRLSVVIVNWNSREDLLVCLDSLAQQTHRDLEIVVVDNGSKDGSVAAVREKHPSCVVLAERENLGFAEGGNRGIAASHGEWVALLNNDTVADPHWAEHLVAAAEAAPPGCGMLQSVLLFMDRPTRINSTGIVLTSFGSGNDRQEGERSDHVDPQEIFCPTAGACAYRRTMLEEVKLPNGYFDREHFMYFEDLDLGWRARLAGWSAQVVPKSLVHHKYQGSAVRHGHDWMLQIAHTNRLRTLLKNASPAFILRTMPRTIDEVAQVARLGGVRALAKLVRAGAESLRQRGRIGALARNRRDEIEAAWVGRDARPRVEGDRGLRICFVVQRYGREVNGGAELHCRELAEHLARRPDVEEVHVLTTCARSHETWQNSYPPGLETIDGVRVERHPVLFPRKIGQQQSLEDLLTSGIRYVPDSLAHAWLLAQGPFSPALLSKIRAARAEFDVMIFFTYLYSPTVHGIALAPERSILIPTAHDEPPIRMDVFRSLFATPRAIAFNTPEERDFVQSLFDVTKVPTDVVGCGVSLPAIAASWPKQSEHLGRDPFVLFLGRLEPGKGLLELLAGFDAFKAAYAKRRFPLRGESVPGSRLRLVLAGSGTWAEIPDRPDIVRAGFVDDATKAALLAHAEVVVVPSRYESLSLVLLEAWASRRPAMVAAQCAVTSGMVKRTGGGLSFADNESFAKGLASLLSDPAARSQMADAGYAFVRDTYAWPRVEERLLALVRQVAPERSAPEAVHEEGAAVAP